MDTTKENIAWDNKKNQLEKRVELPMHEFFFINFIIYIVPLYFCMGLLIIIEYFFLFVLSINLLLNK